MVAAQARALGYPYELVDDGPAHNGALADVDATFKEAGTAVKAVKAKYWHWDNVHMGPKGHEVIRGAVLKTIEPAR